MQFDLDQITLATDNESQTEKLDGPIDLTSDLFFGGIPDKVRLSDLVYPKSFARDNFSGILRSFKINGISKWPPTRFPPECIEKLPVAGIPSSQFAK